MKSVNYLEKQNYLQIDGGRVGEGCQTTKAGLYNYSTQ